MSKLIIPVDRKGEDDFGRPVIVSISCLPYVDVDLGQGNCTRNGLPGDWHTTTEYGEPEARVSAAFEFVLNSNTEEELCQH